MSGEDYLWLAIAIWATIASIRSIRKNGLRQFGLTVGRRTVKTMRWAWGFFIVMCGGPAPRSEPVDSGLGGDGPIQWQNDDGIVGPNIWDGKELEKYALRPHTTWYGIIEEEEND